MTGQTRQGKASNGSIIHSINCRQSKGPIAEMQAVAHTDRMDLGGFSGAGAHSSPTL